MGITYFKKQIQHLERTLEISQALPPIPQNLAVQKQLGSDINDLL